MRCRSYQSLRHEHIGNLLEGVFEPATDRVEVGRRGELGHIPGNEGVGVQIVVGSVEQVQLAGRRQLLTVLLAVSVHKYNRSLQFNLHYIYVYIQNEADRNSTFTAQLKQSKMATLNSDNSKAACFVWFVNILPIK